MPQETTKKHLIQFINQVFAGVTEQFEGDVYIQFTLPQLNLIDDKIIQRYTNYEFYNLESFVLLYHTPIKQLESVTPYLVTLKQFEVLEDSTHHRYHIKCIWSEAVQCLVLTSKKLIESTNSV